MNIQLKREPETSNEVAVSKRPEMLPELVNSWVGALFPGEYQSAELWSQCDAKAS
jgi:hypothetical protein